MINEKWLEEKMLCFLRKAGLITQVIPKKEQMEKYFFESCFDSECQFCSTTSLSQNDHIPDVGNMVKNDHSQDVRANITYPMLDGELSMLFRALDQTRNMGLHQIYREEWQKIFEAKREIFLKKLEYLVSLQETEK